MSDDTMFGHLASRFVAQREDLATEALNWTLGRSPAAEAAMRALAVSQGMADPGAPLVFRTQAGGEDDGARPDLVGCDETGAAALIVEAKFWAELTSNQPGTYLGRLSAGGLLVFIMPSARLETLWPTICERAGLQPGSAPVIGDIRTVELPSGVHLAAVSWRRVIDLLLDAVRVAGDHQAAADLTQLDGLIQRIDQEAFLPLSIEELTGTTPRRVLDYCSLIDDLVAYLTSAESGPNGPLGSKKGLRAAAGSGWYGHWIRLGGTVCLLEFSAHNWMQHENTPFWLVVPKPKTQPHLMADALHPLLLSGAPSRLHRHGDGWDQWRVALPVPTDVERAAVLDALKAQVTYVVSLLPPAEADQQLDSDIADASMVDSESSIEAAQPPEEVQP